MMVYFKSSKLHKNPKGSGHTGLQHPWGEGPGRFGDADDAQHQNTAVALRHPAENSEQRPDFFADQKIVVGGGDRRV